MGRFSDTWSRRLGYLVRAVIIVAVMVGWGSASSAQDLDELQLLLEELLEGGVEDALVGRAPEGALDKARAEAARGEFTSPFVGEDPEEVVRVTSVLTDNQMLVVHRFCEGRLSPEQMELLVLVPAFSRLEQDFCSRAGEVLLQFGYDMFDGPRIPGVLVNGAIPDNYRLGIGDEIVITFRGQLSQSTDAVVDREGRIVLTDLDPIPAAGRTFGDFRADLETRVEAALLGTRVFASMGAVRLVSVSVIGEVHAPGIHQLTGLSTILDAIAIAGGIRKTGSLRQVRVERNDTFFWLDMYDLLISGSLGRDLSLYDGDRIFVPGLGPTVAVTGQVIRPGIFEMAEGQTDPSMAEVIALAGGTIRPQGSRLFHRTFDQEGREVVIEATTTRSASVMAGDMVDVKFGGNIQVGMVQLVGHVHQPGPQVRSSVPTVRALLGDAESLVEGAYLPFAVLETTEPTTQARRLFAIDLQRVLAGQQDFALRDNDRLVILSIDDIRFLSSNPVQSVVSAGPNFVPDLPAGGPAELGEAIKLLEEATNNLNARLSANVANCRGLEALSAIARATQSGRFDGAIQAMSTAGFGNEGGEVGAISACPIVFDDIPDLLPFALEHVAAINGEVRRPGAYPVTENTLIASVVSFAGGLTRQVDLSRVEITRYTQASQGGVAVAERSFADMSGQAAAGMTLNPGDIIRFNAAFSDRDSGPVLLAGEFVRPGLYDIRRGETLSQLIARAGGLTQQAFPFGAIFTRESVKRAEKAGFLRAAQELNSSIALAATRENVGGGAVAAVREIVSELTTVEPLGRVVMEADPTVLQVRPELDVVLQPGDTLFMPKRPSSVLVTGDVLNPGAQQFVAGTTADQYIVQAGGLSDSADQDRLFLVFPNGVAQPLTFSVWNYQSVLVPPGSTIVSPKNLAPLDLLAFARDLTGLIGQLAITAASIAVIGN
ncbi:MAG: polysaccharide biosynthesis/export protein [Alphaproteobacteria bacterium]|nr:polysaccharide biosynthesis/export protein [Alphaproteobacteria bacterium]